MFLKLYAKFCSLESKYNIYLINSRLELHTVFIIILYRTLSWCQISGKIQEGIYSDQTPQQQQQYTAFQKAFQEDFKYSDFFRDQASQCIGDVRREFILVDLKWDLKRQF